MNSKLSGACIAIAVMLASSMAAHAADLTRPDYKAPAYVGPAAAGWTGWYAGLNAGYAFGTSNVTTATSQTGYFGACATCVAAFNSAGAGSVSPKGFTGGLQLGYNWQWNSVVYGLEADFDALSLKGSRTGTGLYGTVPPTTITISQEVKTDWLATVRPRIGYAFYNFLPYFTGGLAVTTLKYTATENDNLLGGPASGSGSVSKLKLGWTAGLGLEYALFNRWTVKAEYLYVNFGSLAFNGTFGNGGVPAPTTNTADLKAHIVRVGVNYRF